MTNIESELALLDAVGQLASTARARWKSTASGFRAFTLFDPKEVVQTRIIAALLVPRANHGQGEVFPRLFLEAIGEGNVLPDALASTEITKEVHTKSIDWDRRE